MTHTTRVGGATRGGATGGGATGSGATGDSASRADGAVTVRYFASARAAAGRPEERVPAPVRLNDLLDSLGDRYGPQMTKVLSVSSYLVNGVVCHERDARLTAESTVDVLPPFAGG